MDRISQAKNLAERLLGAALDVVSEAQITLDGNWARNPKVVGPTLVSRSITNFRAAMILLNDRHVHMVEARVLARSIYENLIWIGALREQGLDFVKKMLDDDAANKQTLGELVMKISRKLGGDVDDENGLTLRRLIKSTAEQFPGSKKLYANKVAAGIVIESAYVEYTRLSLDAVHCSLTALGRHLKREVENRATFLRMDVHPDPSPRQVLDTVLTLCRGLLGVTITASELVGFTSKNDFLKTLSEELYHLSSSPSDQAVPRSAD